MVRPMAGEVRRWRAGPALPVLLVLAVVVALVGPARPAAAQPAAKDLITGWLPTWATASALSGIEGNSDLLSEASPFWYTAKAAKGAVSLSTSTDADTRRRVVDSLRSRGIAVIPSIADGSAARAMAAVLKDSADRARHVAQLVELATANSYDGVELDYERFAFSDGTSTWKATRPAWVAFVTELGNALHSAGKRLALAVPPMYDGTYTSTSGYWVYDYAGIAPVVDSLRIMTYDYSVSRPGPISPLSFLRRTLSYAVTAFPADRIRMGLPAYGRLWVDRRADGSRAITGTCPTSGVPGTKSFTTASALSYLAGVAGAVPDMRFDDATGEMVATFRKKYSGKAADGSSTTCVVDHIAWWVDARGVAARMPLVGEYGLAGAAVWHIGGVDAASWSAMRAYARGEAPAPEAPVPAPAPAAPAPAPAAVGTSVGLEVPSKHLAGVPLPVAVTVSAPVAVPAGTVVTLKRRTKGTSTWRSVGSAGTDAAGRATFTVAKLSRTTYWRARVAAAQDREAGKARAKTKVGPQIRVKASTVTPKARAKVKLRVYLNTKKKAVKVRRQMLVDGRWKTMSTKRTTAKGRVKFTFRWPRSWTENTYRVVTSRRGNLASGSSETFVIRTR